MGAIGKLFKKIMGDSQAKLMKSLEPMVDQINEEFAGLSILSDEELKSKTREFRIRHLEGVTTDELLPEALQTLKTSTNSIPGTLTRLLAL